MIVRDEADKIAGILHDASSFCDELIVVDTGSIDGTADIARSVGAKVSSFEWIDDFAAARNASFDQCTGEWILWLDADDRIPPASQHHFAALKREIAGRRDFDAISIMYRRVFSEIDPDICTVALPRERIIRRGAGARWLGVVHEVLDIFPARIVSRSEPWVEHRPTPEDGIRKVGRNLKILERAHAEGDRSARTLFYLGNELRDHGRFGEALSCYFEYLEVGANTQVEWERHSAQLSIARCHAALGDEQAYVLAMLAAIAIDPTRAEPYMAIGKLYYNAREWRKALPMFKAATACSPPLHGFVELTEYESYPWDYYSVCLGELGLYGEAIAAAEIALVNSTETERLKNNIEIYRRCIADTVIAQRPIKLS